MAFPTPPFVRVPQSGSGDIDWDAELRKIEREYDGLPPEPESPPEPSEAQLRARRSAQFRARQRAAERRAEIGTWARLALVACLTTALYWWPYASDCGAGLAGLLLTLLVLVTGAVWVNIHTWRHHLAVPHGLAVALLVVALAIFAAQLAPRLDYATVRGVGSTWVCHAASMIR